MAETVEEAENGGFWLEYRIHGHLCKKAQKPYSPDNQAENTALYRNNFPALAVGNCGFWWRLFAFLKLSRRARSF